MDRKQHQADLLYQFGSLMRPLQELVDFPERQTPQTRARASAKFLHDKKDFSRHVGIFMNGEPGHIYGVEHSAVANGLAHFEVQLRRVRDDVEGLRDEIMQIRTEITIAITSVPTELDSQVLEAQSPFQAYCRLKAFFETTNRVLVWADPYIGPSLFHRYLSDLPDATSVCVVTMQRNSAEFRSFLDISRIYSQERGPAQYRFVVEPTNHDRWLRCDDQLYHLGGSAKDAGQRSPFTISKLEPTPENFKKLDDLIASGTELFGPSQQVHQ